MELLLILLSAYLIGSIPFGLVLGRFFGYGDIRAVGSGNIGATNALRAGGKKLGIATMLCDMAKGAVPIAVLKTNYFLPYTSLMLAENTSYDFIPVVMIVILLGHMHPIWLGFKGGKGIATNLGILLAVNTPWGITAIFAWLITALLFRISSLAGIMSAWIVPISSLGVLYIYDANGYILDYVLATLIIALLITFKHRENIKRLLKGTEPKISFGEKS